MAWKTGLNGAVLNPDKYSTILLDLDGTLIDYSGAQDHAARLIMKKLDQGGSEELFFKVRNFLESDILQDIESCRPGAMPPDSPGMRAALVSAELDYDPSTFVNLYLRGLSEHGTAFPGIPRFLRYLRNRYTLGIVSNGTGWVQRTRLEISELMEFPHLIVLSCEVGFAKPDPDILRYAMRLAGSKPVETLFIGDSVGSDMGAAEAAGVDFVYIQSDGDFSAPGPRVLELCSASALHPILQDAGS